MVRLQTAAFVFALALGALPARATTTEGWIPALEIRVQASSGQGTTTPASGTWKMVKGSEPLAKTVIFGPSLCAVGIGGAETPDAQFPIATIWKVTGEYLGVQAGRHAARITSRFVRLNGQESSASATHPLSLREGDSVVLDALTNALDGSCQVRTVTIEARLVMMPDDPALAQARYTADLWLVHTAPDGREQREHLISNVDGSGPMPFMFRRLTFPVPVIDPRQGDAAAIIQLSGAIRTRPRQDGAIDLDIDTTRRLFSFEYPNRHAPSSLAPARKTVTVKPDETTAIDFPPPGTGYVSLMMPGSPSNAWAIVGGRASGSSGSAAPATDGPALEIVKERLVLHTSRFFKGHRTQLLIRLRRAD
jgi:hypothetical protein